MKKRNGNQYLKESDLQFLEQFCKLFNVIYIQKLDCNYEAVLGYLEITVKSAIGDDVEYIELPKFKLRGKGARFKGLETYVLYTPGALGIK
jgi:hypothetical protein